MRIDHPPHRNRHAHRLHHWHLHLLLSIPRCHEGHVHSSATTPRLQHILQPFQSDHEPGNLPNITLTISSLNGFSGTLTLSPPSVPTGITATLNSSMVTIPAGSSKAVALNVTIGASTTPGSYTVSVTSSRGG